MVVEAVVGCPIEKGQANQNIKSDLDCSVSEPCPPIPQEPEAAAPEDVVHNFKGPDISNETLAAMLRGERVPVTAYIPPLAALPPLQNLQTGNPGTVPPLEIVPQAATPPKRRLTDDEMFDDITHGGRAKQPVTPPQPANVPATPEEMPAVADRPDTNPPETSPPDPRPPAGAQAPTSPNRVQYAAARWQIFDPELLRHTSASGRARQQELAAKGQREVPGWFYFEQTCRWMAAGMGPECAVILMRMVWKAAGNLLHTVSLAGVARDTGLAHSTVMKYKKLLAKHQIIRQWGKIDACYRYAFAIHDDMMRLIRQHADVLSRHRKAQSETPDSGQPDDVSDSSPTQQACEPVGPTESPEPSEPQPSPAAQEESASLASSSGPIEASPTELP